MQADESEWHISAEIKGGVISHGCSKIEIQEVNATTKNIRDFEVGNGNGF
jgi:hypothetical protein